ncbi:MAG: NAD(P)-dependent oxidoreductase [Planctomycetales bacterium]|nr:NAD(P)-dependent oxidoreductase [Planctomycetales bacterium]
MNNFDSAAENPCSVVKATGLIGLGLLGSALAERMVECGTSICGYDTNAVQRKALVQLGGVECNSAEEVVRGCDILWLSLPSSDVVLSLVNQLRRHFRPGQIVVDTTTGDPIDMIAIGKSLLQFGVHYVEATVAGSSAQVRSVQAALFLGGDAEIVQRIEPQLASITSTHFYLGPVGSASRFKLVHNLMLGLQRAVLAEGLVFAESLGFDPNETLKILQQTPAAAAVMQSKGWRMTTHNYEPQARLSQHLKDVRLILAQAERNGLNIPLSLVHKELLEKAEQLGFGDADNSAVIEALRHPNARAQ